MLSTRASSHQFCSIVAISLHILVPLDQYHILHSTVFESPIRTAYLIICIVHHYVFSLQR